MNTSQDLPSERVVYRVRARWDDEEDTAERATRTPSDSESPTAGADPVAAWLEAGDEPPPAETSGPLPPEWLDLSQWDTTPVAQELPRAAAPSHDSWRTLFYEMAETLLLTLLIFTIIQAFVQNYRIEGYSMEPTLHEGQRLFVDKISYVVGDPQRGDIIVLLFPKGDPNGPEEDYIKRIIGLPGDTVECQPGQIFVNGQPIDEPYISDPNQSACTPMTLGPSEYFVMGDNRNASSDSRSWGALDRRYIIGRAWFVYWPFEQAGWVPNYPLTAAPPSTLSAAPQLDR